MLGARHHTGLRAHLFLDIPSECLMSEEFMRGNEEVLAATHPRPPTYLKQEGAVRHATAAHPMREYPSQIGSTSGIKGGAAVRQFYHSSQCPSLLAEALVPRPCGRICEYTSFTPFPHI